MRKVILSLVFFYAVSFAIAQIPAGYYNTATGSGYTLKTQLYNIIKGHTDIGYSSLYSAYQGTYQGKPATDKKPNGKVWDMYSDVPGGTPPYEYTWTQTCGNYLAESDCFNREHSMPQSWFKEYSPMKADLFHVYPTDGKVNGIRSNYPFGTVGNASQTTLNGSKLGACSFAGYSGTVFEPIDEYKGDFARGYFYMATRYQDVIATWQNNGNANEVLDGSSDKVFDTWQLNLLYQWHTQDPVSQKEIDRNNAVYQIQGNRNPYIDHPEWVANVWSLAASTNYTVQFALSTGSVAEGNSGNATYNATVSISPALPAGTTATVQVSLGTGTATSGTDFTFSPATLTFTSAATTQQVSLQVVGDADVESNETVVLNLSSPSSNAVLGAKTSHTLTITNDDTGGNPVVQFSQVSGTMSEGNSGTKTYNATVSISPALASGSATVQVGLGTGTATSGTDFTFSPATLTFTNAATTQQVSITLTGDMDIEENETVKLELSNATGLVLGTNTSHTLTITNDDVNTTPTVNFESVSGEVMEGNAGTNSNYSVYVTVSPAPTGNATVQVALGGNTTTQNDDCEFAPVTLTFSPTITTRAVSLTVKGDNKAETTEIVELLLQNAQGMALGTNNVHTLEIDDDEPTATEPTVSASQIAVFPNPATDRLTIRTESTLPFYSMSITDLRGKHIETVRLDSPAKEFSYALKNLPKGIYIFALQVGKQTLYKKVVKQ